MAVDKASPCDSFPTPCDPRMCALAFAAYIHGPTRLMRVAIATVIVNSIAYMVNRVGRDLHVATATSGGTSLPEHPCSPHRAS